VNSTALVALFVLLAFAANSILCRMALRQASIDPASFTCIRLLAGAVTMWLLLRARTRARERSLGGDWMSAAVLLIYAVTFSYAYVAVSTGTGALLLFGAVQLVMISVGMLAGERIDAVIAAGWLVAVAGLVWLLLPGVAAPPLGQAAMMLVAGIAWGAYSLLGRRSSDPLRDTAGNFVRCAPPALLLAALLWSHVWSGLPALVDRRGVWLAVLSGAIASGLGYAAWYTVLPRLSAITAANLQLCVPVIAALGGVALSGESITLRLGVCSALVLGGIGVVTRRGWQRQRAGSGR
jgi:drug/metabolite transporter (DMT)-like permease